MTDLLYETRDRTAMITINRARQGNSISAEAIGLFLEYLDRAESDPGVRVVCLTAAGDKIFCSGADLGGGIAADPEGAAPLFRDYARLLTRIARFPKPTVARVNGHCLAGGTGFMLACDIVLAREDAKFGTPEVNVGLFPMMIGALIFRNVLRKKAMEMILLGEKLSARTALKMGLITRCISRENFEADTDAVLASLTAKSPIGMKIGKQAFDAVEGRDLDEAVHFLAGRLGAVAATRDAAEGIRAFLEKRPPEFTGE